MSGKWNIPLRFFMSKKNLVCGSETIRHPILRNWALLAKREVKRDAYYNPFSIGYARSVAKKLVREFTLERGTDFDPDGRSVSSIYNFLASEIPTIDWEEAMIKRWDRGCYRKLLHNINYRTGKDLRRNVMLLMAGGWGLRNDTKHMAKGSGGSCRFCDARKETYVHLLHECPFVKELKSYWNQGLMMCDQPEIDFDKELAWGLGARDVGVLGAKARLIALKLLRTSLGNKQKGMKVEA